VSIVVRRSVGRCGRPLVPAEEASQELGGANRSIARISVV
jgi:hypothetical protein